MCVSVSACVCLSVRDHVFGTTRPIFTKFSVLVTYGCGSVLLWQRNDMLRISGFMDDVIFALKLRLLDVAARLAVRLTRVLRVGISVTGSGRSGLLDMFLK